MERLTRREIENGFEFVRINKGAPAFVVYKKLADYEDTNLTPEQIVEIDRGYREKCEEVARLEKENKQLKCRCRALTSGVMCFTCPLECEYRTDKFRGLESEQK